MRSIGTPSRAIQLFLVFLLLLPLGVPAQASDEGRLVFRRNGAIWIMKTDGSSQQQITSGPNDHNANLQDGVVVFNRDGQLYRTNPAGDTPVAIPNTAGIYDYGLSPDATELLVIYAANFNLQMYRMNVDGSGLTLVRDGGSWHQLYPFWGANQKVYFGEAVFGNPFTQTVKRMNPDGTQFAELTNDFSQYPRYSAATQRISFVFNQPAPMLRTIAADGSDPHDVPNTPAGIFGAPAPDDDADVIYYQYAGQIWRVNGDGSGNAALTTADMDAIEYGRTGIATPPPDTVPPVIINLSATPSVLWPPNHKLVNVTVTGAATDLVDPWPALSIVEVLSNQPANGHGDGNTSSDWEITGPMTLRVRSERAGSSDRIYTIRVRAIDQSGNASYATTTVRVGH